MTSSIKFLYFLIYIFVRWMLLSVFESFHCTLTNLLFSFFREFNAGMMQGCVFSVVQNFQIRYAIIMLNVILVMDYLVKF